MTEILLALIWAGLIASNLILYVAVLRRNDEIEILEERLRIKSIALAEACDRKAGV